MFKKDVFGNSLFIKSWLIKVIALLTHRRYTKINKLQIEGTHWLNQLPDKKVLIISNHQTYFADAIAIIHVINAALNGRENNIDNIKYAWKLKLNLYYIAAIETMKDGLIPKILSHTGSILVKRTWREKGKKIERQVDLKNINDIKTAIDDGWVITFPQGTTKPFAPVRKGTAHIIQKNDPLVVPIVIDGFRRAFDKSGLRLKKRGVNLKLKVKEPVKFNLKKESIESITKKIKELIEQ